MCFAVFWQSGQWVNLAGSKMATAAPAGDSCCGKRANGRSRAGLWGNRTHDIKEIWEMNNRAHTNRQDHPREYGWRWRHTAWQNAAGQNHKAGRRQMKAKGRERALKRHQECEKQERHKAQKWRQEAGRLRCTGSEKGVERQF